MKAHHKRRLLKLADFLEIVPRERFDMGHWVGNDWRGDPTLSCGTTACALGWATTMPEFRRLGLRLSKALDRNFLVPLIKGKTYMARETSAYLFGISENDHYALFETGFDLTPKQVAKKIREFVKGAVT